MKHKIILIILFSFISSYSFAQGDFTLNPDNSSNSPYTNLSNRWEGLYTTFISSSEIDVVCFVKGTFEYKLLANEVIELQNANNDNLITNIRAVGIPLNMYYRLDACVSNNSSLSWKVSDVLLTEDIGHWNIGVYGWRGSETRKIYIPLSVSTTSEVAQNDNINRLYLRSAVSIESISWRYSRYRNRECEELADWITLNQSYRAGEAIEIVLPSDMRGMYCFDIAAKKSNSQEWIRKMIKIIVN